MIPYGRQDIRQDDVDAVIRVLQSDFLTQGPQVPLFEKTVSEYCGVAHGIAVNSATSALHIACLSLGLGQGDILWTSPITFVASANCALYCGAEVDFVDIDPVTYNMSVDALAAKLVQADKVGKLPKIVVPVHLCGQSCDMEAIQKLAKQYDFKIIEDASHAIGGKYKESPVGGCQYADITIFSFHPVKIITTAEGGMALTNNASLAQKMELYRSHGVTRDPSLMQGESDGPWYYQQIDLGFNYRMTEMQATLGVSQMARLDEYVTKRHQLAQQYDALLETLPVQHPVQHEDTYSAYHLYPIRLNLKQINLSHKDVFSALRENGVGVNLHYIPVHTQPYYREMGFKPGDFSNAEAYYAEAISLPLFPGMDINDVQYIVQTLTRILAQD